MGDAWDVFVLGLERDRLEVERVGPSRTRAVLLRKVLGESFSTDAHRQMVADHNFEREAFRRPVAADAEQSAHMWAWFEEQVALVRLAAESSRVKRSKGRRSATSVKRVVAKSAPAALVQRSPRVVRKSNAISKARQLEIAMQALMNAEPATSGPVSRSERVNGSNASTRSTGASTVSDANEVTNERRAA